MEQTHEGAGESSQSEKPSETVYTTARFFRAIAVEAWQRVEENDRRSRQPNPTGTGWIVAFDPARLSFKDSLVTIVFTVVYLEALVALMRRKRGARVAASAETQLTLEERLARLGVSDTRLLVNCKRLRKSRNLVVHEKPQVGFPEDLRIAQVEAGLAIAVLQDIEQALGVDSWFAPLSDMGAPEEDVCGNSSEDRS